MAHKDQIRPVLKPSTGDRADRILWVTLYESTGQDTMDRQAILDKIAAMLKLQESSDFEGEANAAAAMIDKLCKKYGVSVDEATIPQVLTDDAEFVLFCAVVIKRYLEETGVL